MAHHHDPHAPASSFPPRTRGLTAERLASYFDNTHRLYEWLFSALDEDAHYDQPDPLRHPLVFYLGHTAAFYVNKLQMAGLLQSGIRPEYEELFAKGVDPARAADLSGPDLWPQLQEVQRYRGQVRDAVHDLLGHLELEAVVEPDSRHWALLMGFEHDRIHFETSSVLFRQAPLSGLQRPDGWRYAPHGGEPPARKWLTVPARAVTLGRPEGHDLYSWDNEQGTEQQVVAPFEATAHLISNRDLHGFWADGGYLDERLWSPAGWAWLQELGVRGPKFWRWNGPGDPSPRYRAMFDETEMPWSWPAEVNGFEAQALANWVGDGTRLMREAEWVSMVQDAPRVDSDCIAHPGYDLNLRYGSPMAVDRSTPTPLGFHDAHGNVWQWLADDFRPLPGFAPHPYYADFSQPYFTPKHATLRGGSWASTGTSASRHYRLWFRRHFYQHAGVRLVRDLP